MPFQRIDSEKLSKSVVRQVEQLILRGILRPGERLPSERELAEKLAVSRPSLREALSELQQAGLLTARAGAGIFVAEVCQNLIHCICFIFCRIMAYSKKKIVILWFRHVWAPPLLFLHQDSQVFFCKLFE